MKMIKQAETMGTVTNAAHMHTSARRSSTTISHHAYSHLYLPFGMQTCQLRTSRDGTIFSTGCIGAFFLEVSVFRSRLKPCTQPIQMDDSFRVDAIEYTQCNVILKNH